MFLAFTLIGNCAWLSGYDQRIKLTIDNTKVDATLSNFPVTMFFTSTQAEEIFTEFDADSDYMKCAFTSSDGTTQLYAEKELFAIYKSQYPSAQSDTYVKSTTKADTFSWAYYATDPALSLMGTAASNSWYSVIMTVTNQRFHIDLGSAKTIKRIYYENSHHNGAETNRGVQNFTFWGSNTGAGTFDDLVYANDEGWTQLTISQSTLDQHTASDVADPKYITVTNTTAYRYYAFKFADNHGDNEYMGVRRIELQDKSSEAIYHVKVTSVASGADTDIYYYYDNDHADNTTYIGAINTTAGGNVWDANFKAVHHMVDATTSTVVDSTSNNNDGTKTSANNPIEIAGKVSKAQDFSSDEISAGNIDVGLDGDFTWEYIYNGDDADDTANWFMAKRDPNAPNVGVGFFHERRVANPPDESICAFIDLGASTKTLYTGASSITNGTYYHIAYKRASTALSLWLDGASVDTDTTAGNDANVNSADDFTIGSRWTSYGDCIIDEVRISDTGRSDAWIKATYNSLWDSLLTYGSEETEEEDNAIFFGINF